MILAEKRLMELLDRLLCSSLTDAESDELRQLLDSHDELRPAVLEQLRTHSLLQWEYVPSARSPEDDPELDDPQVSSPIDSDAKGPAHRSLFRHWPSLAVAASLLIVCSLAALHLGRQGFSDENIVGRIVEQSNVRFADGNTATASEDLLRAGTLELTSGRVCIEFTSGVQMEISGPAECKVDSDMLVWLMRGQLTADVPRWARGFTVETPDVAVVDLGTRFGVATHGGGKTDVVVFKGEVDLKPVRGTDSRFVRRLTQGEAARIAKSGEIERIFQVHGDWLDNAWSTARGLSPECVIGNVWDNFGATKSVSYYQIIPHGLGDDCSAYVDHPHQWNAMTVEGLPGLLRDADYVRTVNDYRYLAELSLRIEFADDAMLLIFFDKRVRVPEWLTAQFTDTGLTIGLDEDAWYGNPTYVVETGPGNSIDNEFSVWCRKCVRGEVQVLGSMGVGKEARAMYGIAAVSLDRWQDARPE